MTRRPNLTKEQKDFAAEKREAGWSHARIARRLDVSQGSIAWHCLAMGADTPNARPLDKAIKGPHVRLMTLARHEARAELAGRADKAAA